MMMSKSVDGWDVASYKLWYNYLKVVRKQVRGRCVTDPSYEDANSAFERALVFMHKVSVTAVGPILLASSKFAET